MIRKGPWGDKLGTSDWEYASPLESHPEIMRAVGMVIVEMGILDLMLGRMLGGILGIGEQFSTAIYTTPHSAFARLSILENALGEYIENEEIKEIRSLVGRAKSLTGKRHELMHGLYGRSLSLDGTVGRSKMPLTSANLVDQDPVDLKRLNIFIADIRRLIRDVVDCTGYLFAVKPATAPLQRKPHEQSSGGPKGTPYRPRKGKRKTS